MAKRWVHQKVNGKKIVLRDLCEKMANWIRKFRNIEDVVVQYDLAYAALPWAGVRFLMQASYFVLALPAYANHRLDNSE
jgi:hypothetical protein